MMYGEAIKAAQDLASIVPLLGGSTSRKDYEEAIKMVEYLVEHEPDSPLVDMLAAKIDDYEDNAPEFAEFNARIATESHGISLLRILMDQYGLKQSDFEEEIGQRSLVSRILKGERSLTLDHMRKLAKRFNIPVARFVD
ncbi:TPA: helix-turn-helix domain-containing protein [Salmonella enterica subsp. enterica serovar Havana]|uniref:Helix-turn-helix domain-containing protein n=2 Tax=Salmonella enterica I TaxID=59201 RepID=A0A5U3G5U0_SALET|nr:helix-turn-helix domain-containing protein [Salmonella enterica]EBP4061172.1 helix-turn-helix domain-containing protein [Salmonella enterica subsp. enterica]EBQ8819921.1 helix-turn-helix domain-containing protein [Salmonella enterica subsp. enterica serovar Kisarawe]EBU7818399.1 helix-turn-helix domain-containing protein [Salmonella enterica subsp. enterica serovar Oranienburg]EBV7175763.1 helix-turn-helix domain-containing protein [Salmonella enterica subsp. enterica serovar Thompson]ECB40